MQEFLAESDIIDWHGPDIVALVQTMADDSRNPSETAKRCFEWVRDNIRHTGDFGLTTITCAASDVLRERTGYCFAKSHLLAALLRANGIPAGFCYQRFPRRSPGPPYSLHGLNAVHLPEIGWYRVDARGNRPDIDAQFEPPTERLAFPPEAGPLSFLQTVYPEPLPAVVEAPRHRASVDAMLEDTPVRVLPLFDER